MKSTLIPFLFFCCTLVCQQNIDVSSVILNQEVPIEVGMHEFYILNYDSKASYTTKVEKQDIVISELSTPDGFSILDEEKRIAIGKYNIEKGQQIVITVTETLVVTDPTTKVKTKTIKTFTYKYKTEKRGEWRTTFGFNFIYKINQDTYFSDDNGNSTFTITEGRNRDKFDFHPTLMFTWLSNKKHGDNKNWQFGWSGGLGYDFNTSLSVFAGKSVIYNENIILTLGVAFHQQNRLNSEYSSGDIINEDLSFSQLHTEYIRINPFISLAFRLDKNPFEK